MPNIQFHANDEDYFKHKNLPAEDKREVNDTLRETLHKILKKYPDKK